MKIYTNQTNIYEGSTLAVEQRTKIKPQAWK
jgi:hypothetical protein